MTNSMSSNQQGQSGLVSNASERSEPEQTRPIPADLPSKLGIALHGDRIVSHAVNQYFSKQAGVTTATTSDIKPRKDLA